MVRVLAILDDGAVRTWPHPRGVYVSGPQSPKAAKSHGCEPVYIKAALGRYGTPSNAPNTLPMQWYARPNANTGIGCPLDDAKLDLSQVQLTLTDPAWQQARINFIQGQQAVEPRL